MPKGVSALKMANQASTVTNATAGLSIAQVILQICFKGSADKVTNLLFYLQITKSIDLYEMVYPSNA